MPNRDRRIGVNLERRAAIVVVLAAIALGLPPLLGEGRTVLAGALLAYGIVGMSLVVLTGWAGQVSLGQFGFVAIGAVVGGALTAKVGMPFWFAVPIAAAFTGAFAALVEHHSRK